MLSWSTIHLQCGRPSLGSLGWEDPLENGKATHSSTLAWRIPGHGVTYYTVHGVTRVGHDWATFTFTFWASPVAQMVKNPLAVQKTWGFNTWVGKIPWRRELATYSSMLAWRIPWTEEPGRLQSMELQRVRHDWVIKKKKVKQVKVKQVPPQKSK